MADITSLASNETNIFTTQRCSKLKMVDGIYTYWTVTILSYIGQTIRRVYGG